LKEFTDYISLKFKSADEFKQAITGQLGIVGQDEYDRRIKEFESVGIFIDVAGKMYKVTSKGSFNNAKYTIVAYVDLPIKPQPKKKIERPGLTEDEIEELREAFNLFDTEATGKIDPR
jgi:hypothetical protein